MTKENAKGAYGNFYSLVRFIIAQLYACNYDIQTMDTNKAHRSTQQKQMQ